MLKSLGEGRMSSSGEMLADRQTDRQTNKHAHHNTAVLVNTKNIRRRGNSLHHRQNNGYHSTLITVYFTDYFGGTDIATGPMCVSERIPEITFELNGC